MHPTVKGLSAVLLLLSASGWFLVGGDKKAPDGDTEGGVGVTGAERAPHTRATPAAGEGSRPPLSTLGTGQLQRHLEKCAQAGPPTTAAGRPLRTSLTGSEILLQGGQGKAGTSQGTTGVPVVGFIFARDQEGTPTCRAGDMFEATAWSDRNRVFVKMSSVGYGVYRFSFRPVVAGSFNLSVYLMYESALGVGRSWPAENETTTTHHDPPFWSTVQQSLRNARKSPTQEWCASPLAEFKPRSHFIEVSGGEVLPQQPCGQAWHGTQGLSGSWVRAEEGARGACRVGLCAGDLRFMASDGWVWVPHSCYLRLYNREAAWSCLAGKRLLWFGDSTLKQPATNLVENLLGVPVLRRSFNWVRKNCPAGEWIHKRKYARKIKHFTINGCTGPFDHRQWKITRTNPENPSQEVRLQYVWGGSVTPYDPPSRKPTGLFLLLQSTPAKGIFAAALKENPDHIFLHQYIWDDIARFEHLKFQQEVGNLVSRILETTSSSVHWDTGHPQCMSDMLHDNSSMCTSSVENKVNSIGAYMSGQKMLGFFAERYADNSRVSTAERYAMAHPHVMGLEYCYFGVHFGSQPAFCHITRGNNPWSCYRNWLVDKFEIMIWMNKMCAVPPPTSSRNASVTIESGVTIEEPDGLPFARF